ncbi:MAG: response regulator [Planctomycetes bacterium]|nr:response regulator [Planctomycetota bacterium]
MNLTPKLVLHVDDDPAESKLISYHLKKHGYEVVSVQDPSLAMETLIRTGARVVLLDIDIPHKDGLTLLREIKLRDAGIQVTMCTGMVSMQTVLRSTSLGAEGLIFKPLRDLNKISEAIDISFNKIEKWWVGLAEWKERNREVNNIADSEQAFQSLATNRIQIGLGIADQ